MLPIRPLAILAIALPTLVSALSAQSPSNPSKVDFDGFLDISQEVRSARADRLLSMDEFLSRSRQPGAILLDTRSRRAYDEAHLAGAVHLNFSDITASSLAKVLGDPSRPVFIYCNNNFSDDVEPFLSKLPPAALNIPTFVTLWTYGYRNVWELADVVELGDERLEMVASPDASISPLQSY